METLELSGERTPVAALLRGLVARRHLLLVLARKDFHSRDRSTRVGILWSVFVPMFQGAVLTVVFSKVVRIETGFHFPTYVLSGIAMYGCFSSSVAFGSTSIVDGAPVATRVYFPRLILPIVPVAAGLPGLGASILVVLGVMVVGDVPITAWILLLPVAAALVALLTAAIAATVALLHVYFRDVRYVLQAALIVWFYATPIFYPLDKTGSLRGIVLANPVTGPVQLARQAVFGEADDLAVAVGSSLAWLVVVVGGVLALYARHDRIAVDRL